MEEILIREFARGEGNKWRRCSNIKIISAKWIN
jgi:hypothetical protein